MTLQKAVLATIIYHDIFNYPLRNKEVFKYLIENKSKYESVENTLRILINKNLISSKANYIHLKNKSNIEKLRAKREKYSKQKLKKAQLYAKILHLLPTIKCVCVTGALAMNNCTEYDDIDILIICQKKTLWTTRLISNILLFPFKRTPMSKNINNKACLNIFIDESELLIKTKNIYTAHEICQTKVLWDNNSYIKFIKKNDWIREYLPNWQQERQQATGNKQQAHAHLLLVSYCLSLIETLAKWAQLTYMKSKVTTESIGDTQLFFHPKDTQNKILKKYYQKIANI